MSIRLYLITLILCTLLVWTGVFGWTVYQAYRAHTILHVQIAELRPISQAARALHQHWIDRTEAIDARLNGYTSKEDAKKHADTAGDGLETDMKQLEKLLGAASATALQTDLKPQKSLRDLKNSIAVSLQADDTVFSQASPSANDTTIKSYLDTLAQESTNIQQVTNDLQAVSPQSSAQADAYISHITSWWWAIVPGAMIISLTIALLITRRILNMLKEFSKQIRDTLALGLPAGTVPAETEATPLPELIEKLTGKIKSNDSILQQSIAEKEDEVKKVKMGLEKIIDEQKRQYEEKITELSTLNKAMIGRELKMARLKQEIHELKEKTGQVS